MSSPKGASVNDHLKRRLTHVAYASVSDAVILMHELGRGSLLAKVDIRDAYRIVPIHPHDRPFLGVLWQDSIYVDCQLPFGLASAPAIFNSLADALEWILRRRGVRAVVHYLDNFLVLGSPNSMECAEALETTLTTFAKLGVPVALDKVEGPSTHLSFLGIELDSQNLRVSLPQEKLCHLRTLLTKARGMKCVRDYHAFDSLVGHLVHATSVMPLGRAFLSRLFPILRACYPGHVRRLNLAAQRDLAWWSAICQHWVGTSTQQFIVLNPPSHHLFTDASGSWGCGGWALPYWFQVPWNNSFHLPSIALLRLQQPSGATYGQGH